MDMTILKKDCVCERKHIKVYYNFPDVTIKCDRCGVELYVQNCTSGTDYAVELWDNMVNASKFKEQLEVIREITERYS